MWLGSLDTDAELLRYLMKQNDLHQEDLIDVFGNQGNVSKFLNGRRKLSKSQISKLVARFNISADFFFKA
jgi:antitoxin component HigA of HigAB toxin-antitoxin module